MNAEHSFRLIDACWGAELENARRSAPDGLRIVCPFIKEAALQRLLGSTSGNLQVITRFNLADFAAGVSDIASLRMLIKAGGKVRGIRGLHSKLYLFGNSQAVITSANLTRAALDHNHEFGFITNDASVLKTCQSYFNDLWHRAGDNLQSEQLKRWEEIVVRHREQGGRPTDRAGLPDFGAKDNLAAPQIGSLPVPIADAGQSFVKFLGDSKARVRDDFATIDEIRRAGCHWALCYPSSKRPSGVKDGALMFIGRLTSFPNDIRIFGRAIALKHVPGRDDATSAEIEARDWKQKWPNYIRVYDAEFVAGTMANGVSLNELMDKLGAECFTSTLRNKMRGDGNTNPRNAYSQQPGVELTAEGQHWIAERLEAAFEAHGKVPQDTLDKLDWPELPAPDSILRQ